jgi:hypothetical protein
MFSQWLNEWIGACKECDDCPQDQPDSEAS